ncbi:MAG: HEAT repeat domain-containing protein [Planctomycetes bacterium]|nr:HEAT repeat domain-containing protein [Planctomycetota bacterium]
MKRLLASLALTLLGACGADANEKTAGPQLPPLQLAPFLPTLKQLEAEMPAPDEAAQRELREYADIALGIVEAEERIKGRVERSLLEHPDAWWTLEPALEDDNVAVRRRAAWLAGRSGQSILQFPLLQRLKYEADPEAVVWVADALQRLGNDTGLSWLGSAMNSEATAELAGRQAIAICQQRGVEVSEQPTWEELQAAMQRLDEQWRATGVGGAPDVGPPDGKQLEARVARRLATTEKTFLRPIDDARYVLNRSGVLALPLLERTLNASEPYLRTIALQVLTELGRCARPAGGAVTALLADPLTASYATRALGELGYAEALPYVRPRLDAIDSEQRSEAARALGLLGDEQSRGALLAHMQDASETLDVRVSAAFGLCCLGEQAEAERFLAEREAKQDYHGPTLTHLRERIAARSR